jgi:hypothetical protein
MTTKAIKAIAMYIIAPAASILLFIPLSFVLQLVGYILVALIMLWPITMLFILIYELITGKRIRS